MDERSQANLEMQLQSVTFRAGRGRSYAEGDVDDFLDRLVAAVRAGEPLRPLVDGCAFTVVRMQRGYAMQEVDAFLDVVVAESEGTTPTPAMAQPNPAPLPPLPPAPAPPSVPVAPSYSSAADPLPSVVVEQRGLLSRLFKRS